MMTHPKFRILAIVPAYNEAGNIARTVRNIISQDLEMDVLVVDDGSTDATAKEALTAGASLVQLPFNLGIGGAVQTGFIYAYKHQYDVAVQIDGDGQHDALFIQDLLRPVTSSSVDIIVGSRFLEANQGFKSTFSRRIGINFFVRLIHVLTGVLVTDPTSGFRAFNKRAIALFSQYYPTDFPEPEAIVIAHRYGLKIAEVPVLMKSRAVGRSSIRKLKSFYYMLKVTVAIVLMMLRKVKEVA